MPYHRKAICISLKSTLSGLEFCCGQYRSILIRLAVIAPKQEKYGEILRAFDFTAVQGYPRSSILVSMESSYVTSYWSLIVTLILSDTVMEIFTLKEETV